MAISSIKKTYNGYDPELDILFLVYNAEFCVHGMDFVFDITHMLPDEYAEEYETDNYAEAREKLKVLSSAIGRIHGYRVVSFVSAYNSLQCCRKLVAFAQEKVMRLGKSEIGSRGDMVEKLKKEKQDLSNAEREYYKPCFSELRDLLDGKPLPPPKEIQPMKESLGEKVGYHFAALIGGVWFGFLGIGLIATLLFGIIGSIKGCKWHPTDADAERLEYLP